MATADQVPHELQAGHGSILTRLLGENPVPRCGLISGAICGEIMVLVVLINIIMIRSYPENGQASSGISTLMVWNITYPLIVIIIFEIGGIFASRLCRRRIGEPKNAFLAGFISGVTTGIILEVMWFSNIVSLVIHTGNSGAVLTSGIGSILLVIALLIVLVVMGGVLSAFGSFMYSVRTGTVEKQDGV